MRRHRWPVTVGVLWLAVVVGCGGSGGPASTTAATSPPASAGSSSAAEICRTTIELGFALTDSQVQALQLLITTTVGPTAGYVFTDGSVDYGCFTAPPSYCSPDFDSQYADCTPRILDLSKTPAHYADLVDDQRPVAIHAPSGCCGGYGSYTALWGAVAPEIDRLAVTIGNGDQQSTVDALIQAGYFMVLLPDGPCCIYDYVAYDAAGNVIDQK